MDDERRNALTVAQMARLLDCPEEVVINDTRLRQCPPSLEKTMDTVFISKTQL